MKMKSATMTATFTGDIKSVWDVVTDNALYQWRSDLSKIEVSEDGSSFTEYTRDGFPTYFQITVKEPYKRYEFTMDNKNMSGHWTGVFEENGSGTKIIFTEEVSVKNPIMNLFVTGYLKKQQKQYVEDLEKELHRRFG